MATITTIQETDYQDDSRADINNNFSNLNTGKVEKSGDTMTGGLAFSGTDHAGLKVNSLTTAQRDALTPANGMVIYNSTNEAVEVYQNGAWSLFSTDPTGSIKIWTTETAPTGYLLCDGSAISRSTYSNLFSVISTAYGVGDNSTTFNLPDLRSRFVVGSGTAPTKIATFVSRASNVITVSGISDSLNNEFQTGQAVLYTAPSGAMTGLTHNTTYYLIRTGNLTFSLATSVANANGGVAISLSSDGAGLQTFTLTLTTRTLGHTGGEENHALSDAELASHKHGALLANGSGGGQKGIIGNGGGVSTTYDNDYINNTGSDTPHNNMPPFFVLNYVIKY